MGGVYVARCSLSWYTEVSEKLRDPAFAGWFLPFRRGGAVGRPNGSYYSPPCTAGVCSGRFHSQDQTPRSAECGDNGHCDCNGVPCGECQPI